MNDIAATIVVPTTKDRGPLLKYSVGSILNQTIEDIEVFIMGDGVSEKTRKIIHQLQEHDSRIQFFDHPKHPRRGEEYRHQALQEARGQIVCYLCDRDLMFPNHVETLFSRLQKYSFAAVNYIAVYQDHTLHYGKSGSRFGERNKLPIDKRKDAVHALSSVGHTLAFYRKLPYGWRTTPSSEFTDVYMWQQFMEHSECNAFFDHRARFLYFKRDHHPGWPVAKRLPELEHWSTFIQSDADIKALKEGAFLSLMKEKEQLVTKLSSNWLLIKGKKPGEFCSAITRRFTNRLRNP